MTASPPNGPGRTVWLASYPKSGNTWLRAILTALATGEHLFGVNQLGSGWQPHFVSGATWHLGLDPRWLSPHEVDVLRTWLVNRVGGPDGVGEPDGVWEPDGSTRVEGQVQQPLLRKTHEMHRLGARGVEPFPLDGTRAAIHIVRDPRDVACSSAPFFGLGLDDAIDAMATDKSSAPEALRARPASGQTAQPWGTWSFHALSWLSNDVPFPVHLVRYEDMARDTVGTLLPVLQAVGLDCDRETLTAAVDRTRFERLQESERDRGFRETSKNTETFFRRGTPGGWRDELSGNQVAAVEADHREVMVRLGYQPVNDPACLAALAGSRSSRRRDRRKDWWDLPPHLGLEVTRGEVPQQLPGAHRPRPWIHVRDDAVLVDFRGSGRLLVSGGSRATVHWDPDEADDDDPGWILQGWAVTLAMLQRGDLSLHAATLDIGGRVIAVAGQRGAGKSTTSMGLRNRGHQLLVDDVTLIQFQNDEAWTQPYTRSVHLLPDAAEALGLDFDALPLLAGGRKKVAFRAEDPGDTTRHIENVVVLVPDPDATEVMVTPARGAERVSALIGHTRRDGIAPLVLGERRYFDLLTRLAAAAPIAVVRRPTVGWSLEDVLDAIEVIGSGEHVDDRVRSAKLDA